MCFKMFLVFILLLFLTYYVQYIIFPSVPMGNFIGSYPTRLFKYQDLKNIQHCLIEKLDGLIASDRNENSRWMDLDEVPSECSSILFNNLPLLNASTYENKYFLPPIDSGDSTSSKSCSIITFGIGQDVFIEEIYKRNFPQCTFLGFDPDKINKDPYEKQLGGKFVQAAIGGSSGLSDGYICK